eukprot:GILJ01012227.1.p1 GENE.GILJ01012227.1~~GILJ01012227.1.p1  ORF type:complete len:272 (+),score=23.43 GILJ01012227.1:160-975(+)
MQHPSSPSCHTLQFKFSRTLSLRTTCRLIQELIKQLLYLRQQIPMPVETLEATVKQLDTSDSVKKLRLSSHDKKTLKTVEAVGCILSAIGNLFRSSHVDCIAILVGSSVSPKEVYMIYMDYDESQEDIIEDKPTPKDFTSQCIRQMIRTLVTQASWLLDTTASPSKFHVFARLPAGIQVESFIPKQTFKIKQPRSKNWVPKVFLFGDATPEDMLNNHSTSNHNACMQRHSEEHSDDSSFDAMDTTESTPVGAVEADDSIWFQCTTAVNGFR